VDRKLQLKNAPQKPPTEIGTASYTVFFQNDEPALEKLASGVPQLQLVTATLIATIQQYAQPL
jgi:hypothetical protein